MKDDCTFDNSKKPDAHLCFIESFRKKFGAPMFLRLDGIYFNTRSDYNLQNKNIKRTYNLAHGVEFQSHFDKELITRYFGEHPNYRIIHNGADTEFINSVSPLENEGTDSFESVWCSASQWVGRPHKRLKENIRYFLEHSTEKDCLVVAGPVETSDVVEHNRIFFTGAVGMNDLISIYKRSKFFIHLAWLDHCPNVIVDARASGCKVVCSSAGGSKEIAGPDAKVIMEEEWDFKPLDLYDPPKLDFSKVWGLPHWNTFDMVPCATKYKMFMQGTF